MLIIQFKDSNKKYKIEFERISEHLVQITGAPENTNGFYLSRLGRTEKWDYTKFTTLYKTDGEKTIYSDDGTVYTPLEPEPEPEPESEPTQEEIEERERQKKINVIMGEIAVIDEWFREHDYIGIKIATGRTTREEYAEEIQVMEIKAKEKEELLLQIEELTNSENKS